MEQKPRNAGQWAPQATVPYKPDGLGYGPPPPGVSVSATSQQMAQMAKQPGSGPQPSVIVSRQYDAAPTVTQQQLAYQPPTPDAMRDVVSVPNAKFKMVVNADGSVSAIPDTGLGVPIVAAIVGGMIAYFGTRR